MFFGLLARVYRSRSGPELRSRHRFRSLKSRRLLAVEALDRRELLSATPLPITMLSATTVDSQTVTITYNVTAAVPSLSFGVYRSAEPQFDSSAIPVGSAVPAAGLDNSGVASTAIGVHELTIPVPGGLPINPKHPYVVADANPGSATASEPGDSASFHKVVIGVVTHGGLEDKAWKKFGPPWELQMAASLRAQGFDEVIAYNWVSASSTPGQAVKQGPILSKIVLDAAARFPSNEPVDLQFIGHSEGAVVNTQAIREIEAQATPQINAGLLEDTLLDPHAANPDFPGKQYSVANNLFGWIAEQVIDNYQSRAHDPLVTIPAGVDASQVFYQQSPANRDHNENLGVYNLWGQVPVQGATVYYNLTSDGVVHSGKNGVYTWYDHHVVPTLGDGGLPIAKEVLTGSANDSTQSVGRADTSAASYSGKSEPGSTVELFAQKDGRGHLDRVGQTFTGSDGLWTASTGSLSDGRYQVVAESILPKQFSGDRPPVPTATLGLLVVNRGGSFIPRAQANSK